MDRRIVKICGNRFPDEAMKVADAGPDLMGWIFSPLSPRRVELQVALDTIDAIRNIAPSIRHVAVFAKNSIDEIGAIRALHRFDALQIAADPSFVASVAADQKAISLPEFFSTDRDGVVCPAIRVSGPIRDEDLLRFASAPFYILDSYVAGQPGGTGKELNTDFIHDVTLPYLLAGGLTPENVAALLVKTGAVGADVSSGIEDGVPGVKNHDKLLRFIANVRGLAAAGKTNGEA